MLLVPVVWKAQAADRVAINTNTPKFIIGLFISLVSMQFGGNVVTTILWVVLDFCVLAAGRRVMSISITPTDTFADTRVAVNHGHGDE